jgi:hypothetical protein
VPVFEDSCVSLALIAIRPGNGVIDGGASRGFVSGIGDLARALSAGPRRLGAPVFVSGEGLELFC